MPTTDESKFPQLLVMVLPLQTYDEVGERPGTCGLDVHYKVALAINVKDCSFVKGFMQLSTEPASEGEMRKWEIRCAATGQGALRRGCQIRY